MRIDEKTIEFLQDLKTNNNRDWFNANKPRFLEAKSDFENFLTGMIAAIAKFDPPVSRVEAGKCVFRIYRDVRFSKDKTPYKTSLGARFNL